MCECGYTNTRGEGEDGLVPHNTENTAALLLLPQVQITSGPQISPNGIGLGDIKRYHGNAVKSVILN